MNACGLPVSIQTPMSASPAGSLGPGCLKPAKKTCANPGLARATLATFLNHGVEKLARRVARLVRCCLIELMEVPKAAPRNLLVDAFHRAALDGRKAKPAAL